MSADRRRWFLFNASPDIRTQIEAFPSLHPHEGRVTRLQTVLLTDAELDHTLGLLLMREGRGLQVHATKSVHETLISGTGLWRTLEAYCPMTWHQVLLRSDIALNDTLMCHAFEAPTDKAPRFPGTAAPGRVVGFRITDTRSRKSLVYLPCMQQLTSAVLDEVSTCSALLIDGTCWHDDELPRLGLSSKTSRAMGHLPIAGDGGSLHQLAPLPVRRKIYIHLNNTNPVLVEDSPERRLLARKGMGVAEDGLEFEL